MRILFDTNILARAHQGANGPARRALLGAAARGTETLIVSQYLLQELGRVLTYPKLLKHSRLTSVDVAEYLEYLAGISVLVDPLPVPAHILRDRTDEPILGTALAGKADVLCTLDADFFDENVRQFSVTKGIRILTDVELLHAFGIGR
ncbi:MAG TPA: putative toxin-antitoxin system toxin component, PIN family [Terriglobia bacterium]|nr:putative toxin-antitoxin system toxin component, PIN family [Terriglobia bacterium]